MKSMAQAQAQPDAGEPSRSRKKLHMSTSVQLPAAAPAPSSTEQTPKSRVLSKGTARSLDAYPATIQRYMQAEGFEEPTPIQQQ